MSVKSFSIFNTVMKNYQIKQDKTSSLISERGVGKTTITTNISNVSTKVLSEIVQELLKQHIDS